jgi:hypothetical protein
MEKIICSLEEWDSIINYYRPNGSSKSWYLKELKQLSRPLMWGEWNIFNEDGKLSIDKLNCPSNFNVCNESGKLLIG